jgi:hypothetical protein
MSNNKTSEESKFVLMELVSRAVFMWNPWGLKRLAGKDTQPHMKPGYLVSQATPEQKEKLSKLKSSDIEKLEDSMLWEGDR